MSETAKIKLAERYMRATAQFYRANGRTQESAILALQAQAYSIATIIVGSRGRARVYFDAALARAIADVEGLRDGQDADGLRDASPGVRPR